MIYVGNAFSLQMLVDSDDCTVRVRRLTADEVRVALDGLLWQSCVGNADTAAVFSSVLGLYVPCNRVNVTLWPNDLLIVGQLTGGRLPEGATSLHENFGIVWKRVELVAASR